MTLRFLLGSLLLICSQALFCQTEEIRYFTTGTFQNLSQKYTQYKRTFLQQEEYQIVKSYNGNTLLDSGIYTGFNSIANLNNFFRFHVGEQSYMKSRTNFIDKEARVTQYYSDGQPHITAHYVADSSAIHQIWDPADTPILTDGTGSKQTERDDGTVTLLNYENYQIKDALRLRPDNGDTIYLRPDKRAIPKEGFMAFNSMLTKEFEYPQEALEMGLEATLYVRFIIDESGRLGEFEVTNNNKPQEFTKKTLKKLRSLPDWSPAYHNGKPVKTTYVIPIVFRILD